MQDRALKLLLVVGGAAVVLAVVGTLAAPAIVHLLTGSVHGVGE